jgi:hypothetical protein
MAYTFTRVYLYRSINMESLRPISVYQPVGLRPPLTSKLSISFNILSRSVNADGLHLYIMLSQERQGQKMHLAYGGGGVQYLQD